MTTSTIRVDPDELDRVGDAIKRHALEIEKAVDQTILLLDSLQRLETLQGKFANSLFARLQEQRGSMDQWVRLVLSFSSMLYACSDAFRIADGTNRTPGRDIRSLLKNDADKDALSDFAKHVFITNGSALKINQYLLENLPAIKPEWMRFLRNGGVQDLIGTGIDAATAQDERALLFALLGGGFNLGIDLAVKNSSIAEPIKKVVGGVVEYYETDGRDSSKLVSGAITAGLYAIPATREVMVLNNAVQLVGDGASLIVYNSADFLGHGDPVLAEGFRRQSEDLSQALDKMDLNEAVDSVSNDVVRMFNGQETIGAGLLNIAGRIGGVGVGVVQTSFEVQRIVQTTQMSVFGQVVHAFDPSFNTDQAVLEIQNHSFEDITCPLENVVTDAWEQYRGQLQL